MRACCIRLTVRVGFVTGRETRRRIGHTSNHPVYFGWWWSNGALFLSYGWKHAQSDDGPSVQIFISFVISIVRPVAIVIALSSFLTAIEAESVVAFVVVSYPSSASYHSRGVTLSEYPIGWRFWIVLKDDVVNFRFLFLRLSIFLHLSCISYYPSDKLSVACTLVARDSTKKGERGIDCS